MFHLEPTPLSLNKIINVLFYRQALRNFQKCVKPGGLMLIDHRNYDNILDTCSTPSKSIYYNVSEQVDFDSWDQLLSIICEIP